MNTQEMTTQEMNTQEMTCTNVLEELGRIREYHQGRADGAALLEEELKSLLGVAKAKDDDLPGDGAQPGAENQPGAEDQPGIGPLEEPEAEKTIPERVRRSNSPPELGDITVDFTGAENLPERVRRVAEAAGGMPLSPTVVTCFLVESGQQGPRLPQQFLAADLLDLEGGISFLSH